MSKSTAIRRPRKKIPSPPAPPPKVRTPPPDPQQLLRDVAHTWGEIVGLLEGIQQTVEAIAEEADKPESPLHTATNAGHWHDLAGALQDCGAVNCCVHLRPEGVSDPTASACRRGCSRFWISKTARQQPQLDKPVRE